MQLLLPLCCFSFIVMSHSAIQGPSMANTLTQILTTMQNKFSEFDQMLQIKEECEGMKVRLSLVETTMGGLQQVFQNTIQTKQLQQEIQNNAITDVVQKTSDMVETFSGIPETMKELKEFVVTVTHTVKSLKNDNSKDMKELKDFVTETVLSVQSDNSDMKETFTEIKESMTAMKNTMTEMKDFVATITETVKSSKTENSDDMEKLKELVTTINDNVKKLAKECPSDFVRWNAGCYYFSSVDKTRSDALADCKLRAGGAADLVSIETPMENNFIQQKLTALGVSKSSWISMVRVSSVWRWHGAQTGPAIEYTHWVSGFPVSNSDHNCALINSGAPWKWFNYPCGNGNVDRYICETLY